MTKDHTPSKGNRQDAARLSYKFQRLRERLRQAIAGGELSGKLPGERQLARKFRVNAKTLSKALTDLAAEGLLERSIGRGTYVRGAESPDGRGRWLFVVEPANNFEWMRDALLQINPQLDIVNSAQALRPSDLAGVRSAIDMAIDTPAELIRNLLQRGIGVISVNKQPAAFSTHSVQVDRPAGAANLAREMVLGGHRRFLVIEGERGYARIGDFVRQIALRYDAGAVVELGAGTDIGAAVHNGFTAVIAGCRYGAERALHEAGRLGISVPGQVSIGAVGAGGESFPCSGYWVHMRQFAEVVGKMLRDGLPHHPATLWLAGQFHDRHTLGPPAQAQAIAAQHGSRTTIGADHPL